MATTLFPLQYLRQGADPIDVDSVFATTAERIAYLANGRRYPGQIVADLEENKVYCLDNTGTSWIEVGGGGGIPGGLDGQVQFNDGGVFGGNAGFTYDSATSTVGLSKISNPGPITVEVTSTPAWYSLYGDLVADVDDDYSSSVVYDSLGNIYSIGADGNTGVPFLLKYSPSGTLIWQKTFTEVNNYYKSGDALTVDSLDNVYCSISVDDVVVESYIIKLDSSGNIVWQLKLQNFNGTDYTIPPVTDMMVDGSNNLYAIATPKKLPISWPGDAVLIKFSSGGVLQWQRKLSTPDVNDSLYPQGIWVDSAGNSHIVMTYTVTSPPYPVKTIVAKYTTGGVLDWQNEYDIATSQNDYGYNITGDSAGNIYFTADSSSMNIIKADSSGSIIWNKQIDSGTYSSGVALDASGNVYVSGGFDGGFPSPRNDYLIVKYTSAGSLVWQRSFSGSDSDYTYYYWATRNIDVLGENYVIAGYTYTPSSTGNAEAIAVQLKTDGSGTGVYGSFTYGIPAFTESTPAITVQASTLTASVAGLTISAGSLAAADLTKTAAYTYMFGGAQIWSFNTDGSLSLPGYSIPGADGVAGSLLQTDGTGTADWTPYGLPAADGSTGTALITNGAGAVDWTPYSLPTVDGAAGQILTTDGAGTTTWQNAAPTAGGTNTTVQFNNVGTLDGDTRFTYNPATNIVEFDNLSNDGDINVTLGTPSTDGWTTLISNNTASTNAEPKGLVVDALGNTYVVTYLNTNYYDTVCKLDSTGNILWQVDLTSLYANDIAINALGEIFIIGEEWPSYTITVIKLSSSSGAIISKIRLASYSSSTGYFTLCTSGNDIIAAWYDSTTTYAANIIKMDNNGAIIWQKQLDITTLGAAWPTSINCDNLGNIVLAMSSDGMTVDTVTLVKLDSLGAILWQKKYSFADNVGQHVQTTFDSSNNIYWGADTSSGVYPSTLYNTVIVKCDTSGNILWQREIQRFSSDTVLASEIYGLTFNPVNNTIIIGATAFGSMPYGEHTQIYTISTSDGYLYDSNRFYSSYGLGTLTLGYSSYEALGTLIEVTGNRFVMLGRSIAATIYSNLPYSYESAFIASFNVTAGTLQSSGLVFEYMSGIYTNPISLTTTTTSLTVTTPAYTPVIVSGTSTIMNLVTYYIDYGTYTTTFTQEGKLLVSSGYYLPQNMGADSQVITTTAPGITGWVTPAVVSRSYAYSWLGKQTFTTGISGAALINMASISTTVLNGTTSAIADSGKITYYTNAATGNWSTFFFGMEIQLAVNETATSYILVTQGATAYYNKDVWVDGVLQTVSWLNDRPLAGNPNSIDCYVFRITKLTAATVVPATYFVTGDRFKYVPQPAYTYWISWPSTAYSVVSDTFTNGNFAQDASGNTYIAFNIAGIANQGIQKVDTLGNLSWARQIVPSGGAVLYGSTRYSIGLDSSGNLYLLTPATGNAGSTFTNYLIKFNSSGTLLWQRTITLAGTFVTLAVDSSGNSYIGRTDTVVKFDTSGALVFQTRFSASPVIIGLKVDTSGNIYVAGQSYLAKLNSSGSILWQKNVSVTGGGNINKISIDAADNLYALVPRYSPVVGGSILKIDGSTGNLTWCVASTGWYPQAISADASGNLYVASNKYSFSQPANYCKLNSSGVLQWSNDVIGVTPPSYPSVFLDIYYNGSNSSIYLYGIFWNPNLSGQYAPLTFKMPDDGSGKNVYRYAANSGNSGGWIVNVYTGTQSVAPSSATLTNASLTMTTSSLTDAAGTATTAAPSPTMVVMQVLPTS